MTFGFKRNIYRKSFGLGAGFGYMCRKLFAASLDPKSRLKLFLVMGGLSLLFLASPGIAIFLMFSVIGIPLVPATILFPPIVLVWCCVLAFRLILPIKGRVGTLAACIATALLLLLPAQWANNAAYVRTVELTANDHNRAVLPLRSETLAVINRQKGSGAFCGRLCLHALLTGSASTVIVASVPIGTALPSLNEIATAYYFERHAICPAVELDPKQYALPQHGIPALSGYVMKPTRKAAEIATQRIATGTCLMSRKARISEAELMVILGSVVEEKKESKGFQFALKGMEIAQLNVLQRKEAGAFDEVFRATSGSYTRFIPVLVPMASWVMSEPSGWLRTKSSLNDRDYSSQKAWDVFGTLEDTLGIKLELDDSDYRHAIQDGIIAVLDAGRAPTDAEWHAFSLYWTGMDFFGNTTSSFLGRTTTTFGPDVVDGEIATRIVQSLHMPMPKFFGNFVRHAVSTNLVSADVLVKGLSERLRAADTVADLQQAAEGMAQLPDDVLRTHLDVLEELARAPEKRRYVPKLLAKLHLGGMAGAPTLIDLVEAGIAQDDLDLAVQGLLGLCEIGPDAHSVLEGLDETGMALEPREKGIYFRIRIVVSAHLGIKRDMVRRSVPADILATHDADWFDTLYNGSASERSPCHT